MQILQWVRLSAAATCFLTMVAPPASARVERLSFGFYRSASFELRNEDAKEIVKRLNDLLASDAGTGDRPCANFKYELSGTPGKYGSSLPAHVADDEEARTFGSSPFTIHIVASIQSCGGRVGPAGCTFVGGPILIAKRYVTSFPQLFLHEIGHARRLDHHASTTNFMHENITARTVRKEAWQCDALKGAPFIITAQAEVPLSLEDFVAGVWVHGIPVEKIEKLAAEDLSRIRTWVSQDGPDAYAFWPNAVTILGLRGSQGDVELMRRVLGSKSDDRQVTDAKINVPSALGYLVYRTKDANAFELLAGMLSPNTNRQFVTGRIVDVDEASVAMAIEATKGIAVVAGAGNDTARQLLAEQALKQERGAINLGVSSNFFRLTDKLRQSVESKGLKRGLEEKLQ